ncbi:FtsQ-type POTRA domain-containing protein [Ectothiorhodospiraceae bacterium BW-2]|nr:FtsQ-type POTRA domain-containing protein [Ectothiorhodospiraceae bacterium BW-2]
MDSGERVEPPILLPGGRWVSLLLLALLLFGIGYWLRQLYFVLSWPVTSVSVEGELHYVMPQQLEQRIVPQLAAGFLHLDIEELEQSLQQLVWLDRVRVRRLWPQSLLISLEEQQPLALWNRKAVINRRGELFYPPPEQLEQLALPEIYAPTGAREQSAGLFLQLQQLAERSAMALVRFDLDERRSLELELASGLLLKVGRSDQVQRVERLLRIYPAGIEAWLERIDWIDLRYTNGLAIRWRMNHLYRGQELGV